MKATKYSTSTLTVLNMMLSSDSDRANNGTRSHHLFGYVNLLNIFQELGRRVKRATQEEKAHEYLMQRIAVAVQRGNAASVLGTMGNQQNGLFD